jgi:hypothetical protein
MGRILRIVKGEFPAGVDLLCCPHEDGCTAENWQTRAAWQSRVQTEAEFLDALICAGALPVTI